MNVKKLGVNRSSRKTPNIERKVAVLTKKLKQKEQSYNALLESAQEVEKERDFYYKKMFAVNEIFQKEAESELKKKVLAVLYDDEDQPGQSMSSPEKRPSFADLHSQPEIPPTQTQPSQTQPTQESAVVPISSEPKEILAAFMKESQESQLDKVSPIINRLTKPTVATQSRIRQELAEQDFGETYDPDSSGLFDMSTERRSDLVPDLNMSI